MSRSAGTATRPQAERLHPIARIVDRNRGRKSQECTGPNLDLPTVVAHLLDRLDQVARPAFSGVLAMVHALQRAHILVGPHPPVMGQASQPLLVPIRTDAIICTLCLPDDGGQRPDSRARRKARPPCTINGPMMESDEND